MGARYAAVIAFFLCTTAFPASAGAYYSMVGGICTDGSRDDNGELLCSYHIADHVELTVLVRGGASAGYGVSGVEFGD